MPLPPFAFTSTAVIAVRPLLAVRSTTRMSGKRKKAAAAPDPSSPKRKKKKQSEPASPKKRQRKKAEVIEVIDSDSDDAPLSGKRPKSRDDDIVWNEGNVWQVITEMEKAENMLVLVGAGPGQASCFHSFLLSAKICSRELRVTRKRTPMTALPPPSFQSVIMQTRKAL